MSRKYPRLYRREHTFYMRIAIPRDVQIVALRREFLYSLMTTDYLTAIRLYHIESVAMDKFITLLRIIAMRVSKRIYPYGVEFENTDIDDILVHRLEEIIKFCEDNIPLVSTACIASPMFGSDEADSLTNTHPSIKNRIKRLKAMSGLMI